MLFTHQHSLQPPVNTVAPTITGNFINGQVLSGSDGTWTGDSVETQYRWLASEAPYATYAAIGGAASSGFTVTATEIGKRLKRSIRKRGKDGFSAWVDSAASAIVQDSPALPLELVGTPIATAVINSPYSFAFAALNGEPSVTPPKYTFSVGGTPPPGYSVTIDSDGDQGTFDGPFTTAGIYDGLTVNVLDSASNSDSIGPFAIEVIESSAIKLTPGTGWTGVTAAPASRGSSSNVGWGHKPFMGWADFQFDTLTGLTVYEILIFAVPTQADFDANGTEVAGVHLLEASVGNGPWATIPLTYDPTTNRWSGKVLIDPSDFPDGTWTSGSLREIRARGIGKNGDGFVLQGSTATWPYATPGMFFSTNAGGTLPTVTKWVANGGSDSADGSSGTPYATIGKAASVVGLGGIIKLKAGNHRLGNVTTALTDNGRWLTIQADDGLTRSQVVINSVGGASQWLVKRTKLRSLTFNEMVPNITNNAYAWDGCNCDQNIGRTGDWVRVKDRGPAPPGAGALLTYYVNTNITNYAFGPQSARLVKGCTIGRLLEDAFGNTQVVLNSTADTLISGRRETEPGVWDGGQNAHPDVCQYNMGQSNYANDRTWGGLHYNVTINTGNADAQGPFFKDIGFCRNIYIINYDLVLKNSGRNAIYLHRKTENGVLNITQMLASMFFNVKITNGINGWSGPCDDVVAIDLDLNNMQSGANAVPSQMLNYTPA